MKPVAIPSGLGPMGRAGGAAALLLYSLAMGTASGAKAEPGGRQPDGAARTEPRGDLRTMNLEELLNVPVYAASRREQSASEAPSAVTVLTAAQIEKYGWRNLSDLLRYARGFYSTYDRAYGYVGVRGIALPGDINTKILLLVDGHRTNDELYNQAYVREDFVLDLDLVDRVEIIRGPASCLYGSDAFFAVVNVITRKGRSMKGFEFSGESGSDRERRGRLSYGNSFVNGVDLVLSGSLYDNDGANLFYPEFDTPAKNDGVAPGLDFERNDRLFARLSRGGLTLEAARVSRRKAIPTASWGSVFPDPAGRQLDQSYFGEARLDTRSGATSVFARASLDSYRYNCLSTIEDPTYNPEPPYRFIGSDNGVHKTISAETKLTREFLARHTGTVGGEVRDVFLQRQTYFVEDPRLTILDVNRPAVIWALFAQDEIRLTPRLILDGGIRYDHYSTFGGTANPRAAAIWAPGAGATVKLLFGRAFRAPNAYEMYWNDGGMTQKAAQGLQPERITSREVVLEKRLGGALSLTAAGYHYSLANLINVSTDPEDGLDYFTNHGTVTAWGGEAELMGRWEGGFEGRVSVSVPRARDGATGRSLPNSPDYTGKWNLIAPVVGPKLSVGLEGQYIGPRDPVRPSHATGAEGYALYNLTVTGRNLIRSVNFSASVYNLLDHPYSDLGGPEHVQELIPQDGRSYRIKLTYAH